MRGRCLWALIASSSLTYIMWPATATVPGGPPGLKGVGAFIGGSEGCFDHVGDVGPGENIQLRIQAFKRDGLHIPQNNTNAVFCKRGCKSHAY